MNKTKKILIILAEVLLIAVIAIISFCVIKQIFLEKSQDNVFKELENIIIFNDNISFENIEDTENVEEIDEIEKPEHIEKDDTVQNINLQSLYNINSDIVGWIKIDGTNINYPVMQNEEYYLNKDFYKNDSTYGTPFLASYCNIKTSDNLIIYGHHMKNHKMFSDLENYTNKAYYSTHELIEFYTLENGQTIQNKYEIIFAFKTVAYSDEGFKYHTFYKASDEEEFNSFISKCKELELYNTGKTAEYGNKLITLSTCEYSQTNGRMVVVAKKI